MQKIAPPVMNFVFQTIKLDQVADLIPISYRSKYEAIRQQVIEKIKTMAGDETFMFQPQDKKTKLDDNLIARICHGINTAIAREGMNWKIAFSEKAKAFVVAPYKRYKMRSRAALNGHVSIAKLTGEEEGKHLEQLLKLTHTLFGYNLKDLQLKLDGLKNPSLSATKKAFIYVARRNLGVKIGNVGKLLHLSSASSTTAYYRGKEDPVVMAKAKILTDALNTPTKGAKS